MSTLQVGQGFTTFCTLRVLPARAPLFTVSPCPYKQSHRPWNEVSGSSYQQSRMYSASKSGIKLYRDRESNAIIHSVLCAMPRHVDDCCWFDLEDQGNLPGTAFPGRVGRSGVHKER